MYVLWCRLFELWLVSEGIFVGAKGVGKSRFGGRLNVSEEGIGLFWAIKKPACGRRSIGPLFFVPFRNA